MKRHSIIIFCGLIWALSAQSQNHKIPDNGILMEHYENQHFEKAASYLCGIYNDANSDTVDGKLMERLPYC